MNIPRIINFSKLHHYDLEHLGKNAYQLGLLAYLKIPIPYGFVISETFLRDFLEKTKLLDEIYRIKNSLHPSLAPSADKFYDPIREKLKKTHFPHNLALEIIDEYKKLGSFLRESSLNISASPKKGKYTYCGNIKGDVNLLIKIKELIADMLPNLYPLVVQKNISKSNEKTLFTHDESIPDNSMKEIVKNVKKFFYFPQEIKYVINGKKLYVTHIKPLSDAIEYAKSSHLVQSVRKVLLKGNPVLPGIATGPARIVKNIKSDIDKIKAHEIVILEDLSLLGRIAKAKALVAVGKVLIRKNKISPLVDSVSHASKFIKNGSVITVNGITGEIYAGGLL